jgi:hypothetical protein
MLRARSVLQGQSFFRPLEVQELINYVSDRIFLGGTHSREISGFWDINQERDPVLMPVITTGEDGPALIAALVRLLGFGRGGARR